MERAGCGGVGGRLLVSVLARVWVGWVARCWALRDQAAPVIPSSDGGVSLVFLWLFGCWIVDASIFVAVLLKTSACLLGGLGVLFCCVCVCGDKL